MTPLQQPLGPEMDPLTRERLKRLRETRERSLQEMEEMEKLEETHTSIVDALKNQDITIEDIRALFAGRKALG